MLLNQTDVVVDEDLEKVIIPIDSSTEGTLSRATSTLTEKLQKPPMKQRRVYSWDECTQFWMLKISWNYIVLNEIRWNQWNLIKRIEYKITKIKTQLMLKQNKK